jgi:hypothetical protein
MAAVIFVVFVCVVVIIYCTVIVTFM